MESKTDNEKILLLIADPNFNYSNENSAVLKYLNLIKDALQEKGHFVKMVKDIIPQRSEYLQEKSQDTVPNSSIINALKNGLRSWKWLYQSLAFRRYFKKQDELLYLLKKTEKFDRIIELHTYGSTIGAELSKIWKAKFTVIFDSPTSEMLYEMYGTKTAFWGRINSAEQTTYKCADKVMCYSEACGNYISDRVEIKAPISTLPCIIYKEQVEKEIVEKNKLLKIGFIGSFLNYHKVDLLVSAFCDFHVDFPESELYLVGYGEMWHEIKEQIKNMNAAQFIHLTGFVSESELTELKAQFDVGIMPGSNWYGSPLKLFEYGFADIPFIAPPTPTIKSIFSENHCLFIDEKNPEKSIRKHLTNYAKSEALRAEKARAAKEFLEKEYNLIKYKELLNLALLRQ